MMTNRAATLPLVLLMLAVAPGRAEEAPRVHNPEEVQAAADRGTAFLVKSQNEDGSWGGPQNAVYTFTGQVWSNPETHRAWKAATTGLCVMALRTNDHVPGAQSAIDKAVDYLLANVDIRRPSDWDTMHGWAYLYGLQALSEAYADPQRANHPKRAEMAEAIKALLAKMEHAQSVHGGWGYLELDPPRTARQQWGTSFMTASGIIAMDAARRAGFTLDPEPFARAVTIVKRCRLPNGAFSYHIRAIPNLQSTYIDQVKGSLSRIQVGLVALRRAGEKITDDDLRWGLDQFFEHHKFLDIALNKPIPHETYYYNSGYFYLYGHYYASLAIAELPPADQAKYFPRLQHEVMKIQQADGSMWDYDMHGYHKPYGTAFGVLTMTRSLER